jgi:hypothetical protein
LIGYPCLDVKNLIIILASCVGADVMIEDNKEDHKYTGMQESSTELDGRKSTSFGRYWRGELDLRTTFLIAFSLHYAIFPDLVRYIVIKLFVVDIRDVDSVFAALTYTMMFLFVSGVYFLVAIFRAGRRSRLLYRWITCSLMLFWLATIILVLILIHSGVLTSPSIIPGDIANAMMKHLV